MIYTTNLPNYLTLIRILLIPLVVFCMYLKSNMMQIIAAILFIIAGITDFLDGYLARKLNAVSNFGKMLDPIADKLMNILIIIMLIKNNKVYVAPCLLIVSRELVITGLREFLSSIKFSMPVSNLAKIKTFMQMISLFILMIADIFDAIWGIKYFSFIGNFMIWITAIITIITGYSYLNASKKYFFT